MLITVKKGFKAPCAVRAPTLTTDKPGMPQRIPRCTGFHHHQTPSSSTRLQLCHLLWGFISEFILYLSYTQPTSAARRHLGPPEASSAQAHGGPSGKPDRLVMARPFLGGLSHLRRWKRTQSHLTHLLLPSCPVIPSCHCADFSASADPNSVFQLPPRPWVSLRFLCRLILFLPSSNASSLRNSLNVVWYSTASTPYF